MKKYKDVFRPIKGFEENYNISYWGVIYSINSGRFLAHDTNNRGYKTISLYKNGKPYKKSIHRLVAETFVDGYFEGAEVNHLDGNKANNHYSNLQWVTHSQNIRHADKAGLRNMGKSSRAKKITDSLGNDFESITEAASYYGVARSSMSKFVNNPDYDNSLGVEFRLIG